jgi:hypothetical protein
LNQIRGQEGGIKKGKNDLHAILSRGYHQAHILMQRYTLDSSLKSIELQKSFFANVGVELSNKFFEVYGLLIHDFLCFLKEFLSLALDKKIFNLDSVKSLIDEDGKKIESFLNLISLDVKNANKVFSNWGEIHKMDFSSMKQDILTPFYPRPLLEYESEYMLYSRKLLYITAHYHLYDLIKKVANDLSGLFESHIKSSLQVYKKKNALDSELICSGGKGGVRKKNADFIVKEKENLILIEAKCTSPKNQDILRQGKKAEKTKIEKAVTQIMSSYESHKAKVSNAYGLIVTYKPFFLGRNEMWLNSGRTWSERIKEEMRSNKFEFCHLFVCSIEDFDTLVNFANDKNLLISHILKRIATYSNNNEFYDFSDGLKEVMNEYN